MTEQKRDENRIRRTAETAADFALGGASVAVEKGLDAIDEIQRRGEKAVEDTRRAVRRSEKNVRDKTAEAVRDARQRVEPSSDARSYEDRTRDELYDLAAERDIAGRSAMRKSELIAALRAER